MSWFTNSGIIGPAIGGVIAATVGLLFTLWKENRDKRTHQKIVARALYLELRRYQNFIDYFKNETKFSEVPLIGNQLETTLFMVTLSNNPFIKLDINNNSSLISNKSPFEIFFQDIYKFDNQDLIRELLTFYEAIIAADINLKAFFSPQSDQFGQIIKFVHNIERADESIFTIENEGWLDPIRWIF